MPGLLRRALVCFYCNAKSDQKFYPGLQRFQCRKCEATNFLDKHGSVTDPPVEALLNVPASASSTYTLNMTRQRRSTTSSNGPTASTDALFCRTCMKNQFLLTQALASYLPSTSHPQYAEFEATLPEYRRSLEEKYPQVCRECEPKVRQRIRSAQYVAKSDYLRRLVNNSSTRRSSPIYKKSQVWRLALAYMGALGCCLSWLGQIQWHIIALLVNRNAPNNAINSSISFHDTVTCWKSIPIGYLNSDCYNIAHRIALYALLLGLTTVWWSTALHEKLRNPNYRLHGVQRHLILQFSILLYRYALWIFFRMFNIMKFSSNTLIAIHTCGIMSFLVFIFASRSVMFVKPRPSFRFKNVETLVDGYDNPDKLIGSNTPIKSTSSTFKARKHEANIKPVYEGFNVLNGTKKNDALFSAKSTSDPQSDSDSGSAMEWTPTNPDDTIEQTATSRIGSFEGNPFQTGIEYSRLKGFSNNGLSGLDSSPFVGRLPPAPIPPSHKLMNPILRQVTQHRELTNGGKSNFAINPFGEPSNSNLFGVSTSHETRGVGYNAAIVQRGLSTDESEYHNMELRASNWNYPQNTEDTGLEGLFDRVFCIDEKPLTQRGKDRIDTVSNQISAKPNWICGRDNPNSRISSKYNKSTRCQGWNPKILIFVILGSVIVAAWAMYWYGDFEG